METQLTLFDISRKCPKYWIQTYFDFDPVVWCEELIARSYMLKTYNQSLAPYIPYKRTELNTICSKIDDESFSSCMSYGRDDVEDFFEWSRVYCDHAVLSSALKVHLNIK